MENSENTIGQRIVCSANKVGDEVILGLRHWDMHMHTSYRRLYLEKEHTPEVIQGFIDNRGNFLTRTEAWKVAEAAGQIIRRVGSDQMDGGTLFSENLY